MIISLSNIKKSYIENLVLDGISFHINEKDKVGLIGSNGSGKTTLMNLLAGKDTLDQGEIHVQKELKIGYLTQYVDFDEKKSLYDACLEVFTPLINMEKRIRALEAQLVHENNEDMEEYSRLLEVFEAKGGYEYPSRIRGMLIGLGFSESDFERVVQNLSGGQKSRILLARLLLESPDLLLLDEPTNHLDLEAVNYLEVFLKEYRGSLILISHDRYFVQSICNRIFHLQNHKLDIYNMPYEDYRQERKKRLEIERHAYENQQKEIKRQEEIIQRFSNYQGARYVRQTESRRKMLDRMKKLPTPSKEVNTMHLRFKPICPSGKDVLVVEDLSMGFGEKKLFSNISFQVYRGEKVGLIGDNGVGKTTIFRLIEEELSPVSGKIKKGVSVRAAYFDQEQKTMNTEFTLADELWEAYPKLTHYELRSYLARFQFFGDDLFRFVGELSGGERARLSLLKLMLSSSNFLLLDEPTNHLDIESREVLENALNAYDGTVLFISHDRYFLNQVADKILYLSPKGIMEFPGNYDYYQKKLQEMKTPEEEEVITKTQKDKDKRKEKKQGKEERVKKLKIRNLEEEIFQLEEEKEQITLALANPDAYNDLSSIREMNDRLLIVTKTIEEKYELWFDYENQL